MRLGTRQPLANGDETLSHHSTERWMTLGNISPTGCVNGLCPDRVVKTFEVWWLQVRR